MGKVQSVRISTYKKMFAKLEKSIQEIVQKSYNLWIEDPSRVDFKELNSMNGVYSARINARYRALCKKVKGNDGSPLFVWFFVGSHEDYNKEINNHKIAEHLVDSNVFEKNRDKLRKKFGTKCVSELYSNTIRP